VAQGATAIFATFVFPYIAIANYASFKIFYELELHRFLRRFTTISLYYVRFEKYTLIFNDCGALDFEVRSFRSPNFFERPKSAFRRFCFVFKLSSNARKILFA
jgi:hypothetical protein